MQNKLILPNFQQNKIINEKNITSNKTNNKKSKKNLIKNLN